MNNKDTDQNAHPQSLISFFEIHSMTENFMKDADRPMLLKSGQLCLIHTFLYLKFQAPSLSLRKHLRINDIVIVDQSKSYFLA